MRSLLRRAGLVALALITAGAFTLPEAHSAPTTLSIGEYTLSIGEYTLSAQKMDVLRQHFYDQIQARYAPGAWAPLRMELSDADLALMGLPDRATLLSHRYSQPTTFSAKGKGAKPQPQPAASPAVTTFAGTGFFGIRPGAWLLLLNGGSVGWCSMAHVYGSPGAYEISTAGHCGKVGDIATAIGLVGDNVPVLIDFGQFTKSVSNGLGDDYALISVYPQYQSLVTPTMCFWGGPRGVFTSQGDLASVSFDKNLNPSVSYDPNPALAQQIVHYGHGAGVGAGGTPRSATAIAWRSTWFMFFGAISPGDSGSASDTLLGDNPGDNMEAAGINTHLYVDPLMRMGLGIMGGTRVTLVGTPADGQIVPYPVPAPGLP